MFASQPTLSQGMMNPAFFGSFGSPGLGSGFGNSNAMGACQPNGCCGGAYQMDPSMQMMMQQNQQLMLMTEMIEMLMMIMAGSMLGQNTGSGAPGMGMMDPFGAGGIGGGGFGTPSFSGASPASGNANYGGGPSSANSASSSAPVPMGQAGSGNQAAVALGRRYLGHNAIDIKGKLPHFTAAGGQTNNCADFVSSLLESTGGLKGHHVGVRDLESSLKAQGYHQVPASQAKPGDVWISNSRSHTEMVTAAGGTRCIGSNNDRPGHQVISEKPMSTSAGVYYTKG